jgi:flavin-dependent dehydrogenase
MENKEHYDIAVVGGGLAGLITAIRLSRKGYAVVLFEKKAYPFHRVCGEYISEEVRPFLESENLFPHHLKPATIRKFHLSSISGRSLYMDLDLGAFGVSRYHFDHWLAEQAQNAGVVIRERERVNDLHFQKNRFHISTSQQQYSSQLLVGAYGKREKLDKTLNRRFIRKRSPYMGVKYHIETDLVPHDVIALHNFSHGYCGVSRIEDGKFNLCYLSHRRNVRKHGNVSRMERAVVQENPHLKKIYQEARFLFDKPEVINEISFAPKAPVEEHVLMCGDTAGMITPLCGNGMAMAIHGAKILTDAVIDYFDHHGQREILEKKYAREWATTFGARHWAGRQIQNLFGARWTSELAVSLGKTAPPIGRFLMGKTHGQPF